MAGLIVAILSFLPPATAIADDDDLPADLRPGLIAQYQDARGSTIRRLDSAVSFVWRDRQPDARMIPGDFSARWTGRMLSIVPGEYRLHVFAAGSIRVKLGERLLIDTSMEEAAWAVSQPIGLEYGFQHLSMEYRALGDTPRLALYWSGPRFSLEPIPRRHLFHPGGDAPRDIFAQGRRLVRGARCAACHKIAGERDALPAPSLVQLGGHVRNDWLIDWLQHAGHQQPPSDGNVSPQQHLAAMAATRMPDFAITPEDAAAIAGYLLSASANATRAQPGDVGARDAKSPPGATVSAPPNPRDSGSDSGSGKRSPGTKKGRQQPPRPPNAVDGRRLFVTLGCLACHTADGLGTSDVFGGGDLSRVAEKRPADFFDAWLKDPAAVIPNHRMPSYELSSRERAHLVAYLTTLKRKSGIEAAVEPVAQTGQADDQLINRGRRLAGLYRCGACHQLPDQKDQIAPFASNLVANGRLAAADSCLDGPDTRRRRPGYRLSSQQKAAVVTYLNLLAPVTRPLVTGTDILDERNCLACHTRGTSSGISTLLNQVVADAPELSEWLPAMAPPTLSGVGDKLHEHVLKAAVAARNRRLRPWLHIRMPRPNLSDTEHELLTRYLIDTDRIPPVDNTTAADLDEAVADEAAVRVAGRRLVTADGFGCTSCHQIGDATPQRVALGARGTDLSLLGTRVRKSWYDRWVRDAVRMVPRMEMPSIKIPIRGVMNDSLDDQLNAVWHVLNQPGFNPPEPNPVRVVRATNLGALDEPAAVLTDVVEAEGQVFIKPLVIALANRHNVLFDLESQRLAGWWIGDAARQRTRGKTWYWEPGGAYVMPLGQGDADVALVGGADDVAVYKPFETGQFATEFDWFQQEGASLEFAQRLRFELPNRRRPHTLSLRQVFRPIAPRGAWSGFRRRVEFEGVPRGFRIRMRLSADVAACHADEGRVILSGERAELGVRSTEAAEVKLRQLDRQAFVELSAAGGRAACEVDYLTDLPVDRYLTPPPVRRVSPQASLAIAPGFDVTRLPLRDDVMPIALAWRGDGTLVVGSLKGRVWLARDRDGDGLQDELLPFSDELAAPYGIAAHGEAIDVINKYALLRLYDRDGDGRVDRTETLASGWGHTSDYHDWAIGLPRDEEGSYYVAFPCQQDDRSPAAAKLRGSAVRLIPREPTADDPRRFRIEEICSGLRFPMGIARSRGGDLFTTDNQGNYNPFNELNHLRPGRHYGFINKLDRGEDYRPQLSLPAIDLPHPWTRSVNGIQFLDTPADLKRRRGPVFGPFEGHLVGCEWNGGFLVRMTLDRIGDTFQGAVYPLSLPPTEGNDRLIGPIGCAISPAGDLYVGNLLDSGWAGSNNIGSIVRFRPTGTWPPGVAEVTAERDGFTIAFTTAVDHRKAAQGDRYTVSSYRRISTPAYGGDDVDRRNETVTRVRLAADRKQVRLWLSELREGFVYELHVGDVLSDGGRLHPAEAHYTLRHIPTSDSHAR